MPLGPFFSSNTGEKRWVDHITRNYIINLDTSPSIFQVHQKLRDENPEAYTPRIVGLGPYHHLRPELQEIESEKRASVRAFLKFKTREDLKKFTDFVANLISSELKLAREDGQANSNSPSTILSHDTYLDLDTETLVWIHVIDGIFLLQFLNDTSKWVDQRMAAEIMMLENQISLAMLENIRTSLKNSFSILDVKLLNQFNRFCKQLSPLKLCQESDRVGKTFGQSNHLLHFLYSSIVDNFSTANPSAQETSDQQVPNSSALNGVDLRGTFRAVVKLSKDGAQAVVSAIGKLRTHGLEIPQPVAKVSKMLEQLQKASDLYDEKENNLQQRLAKIDLLSVSQLHHILKIKFSCTIGGIRNILFDDGKDTLYLPEITLGETSEIVLRNLVAYEAASQPAGSILELAQYVDLMCGIIRAENDVKLLRQFGIIKGNLPDEQIVCIFNGINKTTEIPPEQSEIQRIVQKLWKMMRCERNKFEVPSASKLKDKLQFKCTKCGSRNILFDEKKTILYLPEIKLGNTLEEAKKKLGEYDIEYVDFMCAIIDDESDAEILQGIGILKGDLTEFDIADAFKWIKKDTIQWPNELSVVQKTVQKLNKKCRNSWKIKTYKSMKDFFAVFQSWIKMIFPTLVLMLLFLQSFCEIYGCRAQSHRSGYAAEVSAGGSSFLSRDDSEFRLMMPRKVLRNDPNLMSS